MDESDNLNADIDKFACRHCEKVFRHHRSLRYHVRKKHPTEILNLQPPIKPLTLYRYKCSHCQRNFNNLYHQRYHERKDHGIETPYFPRNIVRTCPLCKQNIADVNKHFLAQHSIDIVSQELNFANLDQFIAWKEDVESRTDSRFVKRSKTSSTTTHWKYYYVCHRAGNFVSESKGKRRLKAQGSRRINAFCPAKMTVLEMKENGDVTVKFVETHIGHDADLRHLALSSTERKLIAEKISSKQSFDSILEDVQNSLSKSEIKRLHLLTKKDLFNISKSCRLSSHENRPLRDSEEEELVDDSLIVEVQLDDLVSNVEENILDQSALCEKESLKRTFSTIVDSIQTDNGIDTMKKVLQSLAPTITAADTAGEILMDEQEESEPQGTLSQTYLSLQEERKEYYHFASPDRDKEEESENSPVFDSEDTVVQIVYITSQ